MSQPLPPKSGDIFATPPPIPRRAVIGRLIAPSVTRTELETLLAGVFWFFFLPWLGKHHKTDALINRYIPKAAWQESMYVLCVCMYCSGLRWPDRREMLKTRAGGGKGGDERIRGKTISIVWIN